MYKKIITVVAIILSVIAMVDVYHAVKKTRAKKAEAESIKIKNHDEDLVAVPFETSMNHSKWEWVSDDDDNDLSYYRRKK